LTPETQQHIASSTKREGKWLARLNRLVLEDAYPKIIKKHMRPIDKAEQLAEEIGQAARLLFIASIRAGQPKLLAIHGAILEAIYEIRNSFNLNDAYWSEWDIANVKQSKPGKFDYRNSTLLSAWDPDARKRMWPKAFYNPPADLDPAKLPAVKKGQPEASKKKKKKAAPRRRSRV
jgi:hypothetical protein